MIPLVIVISSPIHSNSGAIQETPIRLFIFWILINKMIVQEFLLWYIRISGISGVLGCRFDPWPSTMGQGSSIVATVEQVATAVWICSLALEYICCRVAKKEKRKKKKKKKDGSNVILNWRWFCPKGDIWPCVSLSLLWAWKCY